VKVVLTGGRGFLGTHVCVALREAGHEPVPLGRADGDLAEPGTIERVLGEHEPGWRPQVPLEDGIRSTLDWVREAA